MLLPPQIFLAIRRVACEEILLCVGSNITGAVVSYATHLRILLDGAPRSESICISTVSQTSEAASLVWHVANGHRILSSLARP